MKFAFSPRSQSARGNCVNQTSQRSSARINEFVLNGFFLHIYIYIIDEHNFCAGIRRLILLIWKSRAGISWKKTNIPGHIYIYIYFRLVTVPYFVNLTVGRVVCKPASNSIIPVYFSGIYSVRKEHFLPEIKVWFDLLGELRGENNTMEVILN